MKPAPHENDVRSLIITCGGLGLLLVNKSSDLCGVHGDELKKGQSLLQLITANTALISLFWRDTETIQICL